MTCLNCKGSSKGAYSFHVIEVHTLHIRDFDGERVIQALGEFQDYDICAACASDEVQAVLFPAKRIAMKCLPFMLLGTVGLVLSLTLTLQDVMTALRAIGPLAVFVGVSGMAGKVREILKERETLLGMSRDDALKYSAWQLLLRNAPKKYNDNDITYIPVNKDTLNMKASELSERYGLLPAIADKLRNQIV